MPTWLVSAGYSAWHFFAGGIFKINIPGLAAYFNLTTQVSTSKLSDNPDQHSFYGSVNNLLNKNKNLIMGSLYIPGTLPTYPSPKLAFFPECEVHVPVCVDVGLGEG